MFSAEENKTDQEQENAIKEEDIQQQDETEDELIDTETDLEALYEETLDKRISTGRHGTHSGIHR